MTQLMYLYVVAMMIPTAKVAGIKISELLLMPLLGSIIMRPEIVFPRKQLLYFFLFFGFTVISFIASCPVSDYNPEYLLGLKSVHIFNIVRLVQLFICFSVFAVFYNLKTEKEILSFVLVYCKVNTLLCALSLICYVLFIATGIITPNIYVNSSYDTYIPRLMSFAFVEPAPFSIFLVPSLFLCFFLRKKISFAVQLIAFLLTMSSQGFISGLVVFAIIALRKHTIKGISLLILGAVLVIQVPILEDIFINKTIAVFNTEADRTGAGGRHAAMFILPTMIENNPLLGIGYSNYTFLRNKPEYLGPVPIVQEDDPQIGFLQMLAENGIFGFIAFVLMIIPIIILCIKSFNNNITPLQKGIACGCLALWFNLFGAAYLSFHQLWFFAGLTFAMYRINNKLNTSYVGH